MDESTLQEAQMVQVDANPEEPENKGSKLPWIVGGVGAGGVLANEHIGPVADVQDRILDGKFEVLAEVDFIPGLVDAMIEGNDVLNTLSPAVATGALLWLAAHKMASKTNIVNKQVEVHGAGDLGGANELLRGRSNGFFKRMGRAMLLGGGVSTAAASGAIIGSTSILDDVRLGPLRSMDALANIATGPDTGEDRFMLVSHQDANAMGDSKLHPEFAAEMDSYLDEIEVNGVTFTIELPHLTGVSDDGELQRPIASILTGFEAHAAEAATGHNFPEADDCENLEVIPTREIGLEQGDDILINGTEAKVGDVLDQDIEQINREVAVASLEQLIECYYPTDEVAPFGIGLGELTQEQVDAIQDFIDSHEDSANAAIISVDQFIENNQDFWEYNGTPVIQQQYLYLMGFLGVAAGAMIKSGMEKDIHQITRLTALQGLKPRRQMHMGVYESFMDAARTLPLSVGIGAGISALTNMAEYGMRVNITPTNVAVGFTLASVAKITGHARAIRQFNREVDPAEVVRS